MSDYVTQNYIIAGCRLPMLVHGVCAHNDTLQLNVVSQLFNLRNLIRAEIILGNLNRFDRIAIESD